MKPLKYITAAIVFLFTISMTAQQGIHYKALIKDDIGNVVANQNITIQFQILQGETMSNVYQETHTPTTEANGFVIVNIGEGTTSDDFNAIDWGADDHYLNVQINTGSGLIDMGTTQFKAVPYALHAKTVTQSTYNLNTFYAELGGYVIEINTDGTHGLVAAMQDQGFIGWYQANDLLSNAANHDSDGAKFKDWRIPTKRELNLIYAQKNNIGNFSGSFYWSSTEVDNDSAWVQNFFGSGQDALGKNGIATVRAVRAF